MYFFYKKTPKHKLLYALTNTFFFEKIYVNKSEV